VWDNNNQFFATPFTANFACYGTFMMHNVAVLVNLKLLMEAVHKNWWFIGTIWLSIFGFISTTFIYNLFDM
jgi:phospholipid-translocating ATPase